MLAKEAEIAAIFYNHVAGTILLRQNSFNWIGPYRCVNISSKR